jgi:hypothetical protein
MFYQRYGFQNQNFDFKTTKTLILHAWSIFFKGAHLTKLWSKKIFSMKTLSKLGALTVYWYFLRQKYIFCELTTVNGPQTEKTTLILLFVNEPLCFARKDQNIRNIPYKNKKLPGKFVIFTIRNWAFYCLHFCDRSTVNSVTAFRLVLILPAKNAIVYYFCTVRKEGKFTRMKRRQSWSSVHAGYWPSSSVYSSQEGKQKIKQLFNEFSNGTKKFKRLHNMYSRRIKKYNQQKF